MLIADIAGAKRVLLVEPPYRRKYPPLGLAKIASLVREHGGDVRFTRKAEAWGDIICVTSLFTFDLECVLNTLGELRFLNPATRIVLGGVAASLMPERFDGLGVEVVRGCVKELDEVVPDYSIDWGVAEPWDTFSYTFTTRGCPNRCPYCAVWRIEPACTIVQNWRDHIVDDKPNAMISDNNLSAAPQEHLAAVLGFVADKKKRVVFDNGFDCKHITPDIAALLARVKFTRAGMRLAFDRIQEDGTFQDAVVMLKAAGVPKSQIMAYVLFNFNDTPSEADYRMRECVKLGIRPYPQQYEPLKEASRDKKFIGKHWTPNLVRAFRYFWLMAGIYTKTTFVEWARAEGASTYNLTEAEVGSVEVNKCSG